MMNIKIINIITGFFSRENRSKNFCILITDTSGSVIYTNPAFRDLCGIRAEDLKEMKFSELFTRAEEDPLAKNSKLNTENIFRLICKDKKLWFYLEQFGIKYLFKEYHIVIGYNASDFFDLESDYLIRKGLLETAEKITSVFLAERDEATAVNKSLELLGNSVNASRTYLFENFISEQGEPFTSQKYEWVADGITPMLDNDNLQSFNMKAETPYIYEIMKKDGCINTPVKFLSDKERPTFEMQEIVSVLLVPIKIDEEFQGFIGFDDCVNEKKWSDKEVEVLRLTANSIGLFIKYQREEKEKELYLKRIELSLSNTNQGIWELDAQTRKVDYSKQLCAMLGYTREEFGDTAEDWEGRIHPDDQEMSNRELARHLAGEIPAYEYEYRVKCKDGTYKWIISRGKIMERDHNNNPLRVIGMVTDVQFTKDIEMQIAQQRASFQTLFENNPLTMLVYEKESGQILNVNSAACRLYALNKQEFFERRITDLHPKIKTGAETEAGRNRTNQFNNFSDWVSIPKLKQVFYVNIFSHAIEYDSKHAVLMVVSNITDQKIAENALRVSEEKYRKVITSLSAGIVYQNANGIVEEFNPSAEKITGYTKEETIGQMDFFRGYKFINEDGSDFSLELLNPLNALSSGSFLTDKILGLVKGDEETRWIELSVIPLLREEKSKPYGFVTTFSDITESVESDRKIRENQENFRTFFNSLDDLVFILDPQGNIIHVNNTTVKRLGYTEEELLGRNVLEVHPEERREEAGRIVMEMLEGKTKSCPIPIVTKNGDLIPVETRVIRGKWSNQDVLLGTSKDISELRASEEKFYKIFSINPSAMALSSLDGKFVDVNEAFRKLTGYSKEEIVGNSGFDLNIFFDKSRRDEARRIMQTRGELRNFEAAIQNKSGIIREGLFEGHFITLQDRKLLLTVMTDITELKRLNNETREYKKRFDIFFENLNEVVFIHDISGQSFIYINKAAEKLLERPVSGLKGINDFFAVIARSDDKFSLENSLSEVRNKGFCSLEYRLELPGERIKWIWLKMWISGDERVDSGYIEGIVTDITKIKLAQDAMERSLAKEKELSEMKSLFVSTTSHEFRTPLAQILSSIEILESYSEKWTLEKKNRHYVKIKNSVSHLTKMLDDVLFLNRAEVGLLVYKPEVFDFTTLVKELIVDIKATETGRGANLKLRINTKRKEYFLDQKLMTLVLSNLITNAIKYSAEKAQIDVSLSEEEGALQISVADHGVGISEHDLEHIFDPFFRASNVNRVSGSGLGLTIVKKALELHGGNIAIQSKLGKGTAVIINIPVKVIS